MQTYREIYETLINPTLVDDMLQEQGLDVRGTDSRDKSTGALLIYYAQRIKDLEERVRALENQ